MFRKYKSVLKNRIFLRYGLMNAILISAEWCYMTILPFYFIQVIEVSSQVYGYYLGAMLLCYGAGSYLAGKGIDSIGHHRTLVASMFLSILGGIGLIIVHFLAPKNPELVSLCIGICFIGQGGSFAPSIAKALEPFGHMRASASSVRGSVNALFSMIGTLAASLLNDFTLIPMALYIIIFSIAGLLVFKVLRES